MTMCLAVLLSGMLLAGSSHAGVITVCHGGLCDETSIQDAIDAAQDGDIILVGAGTYYPSETIDTLGKAILISGQVDSNGNLLTVIDGMYSMRLFICQSGETPATILEHLIIQNGFASGSFPDNTGGGMYITGSWPTLREIVFRNNVADNGGGLANDAGSHTKIFDCLFKGNEAGNLGGGILNIAGSQPTVKDCFLLENSAQVGGGIANHYYCNTNLKSSLICSNSSDQISGTYTDNGGNQIWTRCDVPEDLNADGAVDGRDLVQLLAAWNSPGTTEDINNDGTVNAADLTMLLNSWGLAP